MTEQEWLTKGSFSFLDDQPLYSQVSGRQLGLVSVAWLRRFDRYWASIPSLSEIPAAICHNDQMRDAIDVLERWADGRSGPLEWGEAVKNAQEAAHFAGVLFRDHVEDDDEEQMRFRSDAADSAARQIAFVRDLMNLCGTPERKLADALAPYVLASGPGVPQFVPKRITPLFSTPQQRVVGQFWRPLFELSQLVIHETASCPKDMDIVYEAENRAERSLMHDVFGNPFRPLTFAQEWRTGTAEALARGMYESRDFSAMPILADALQDAGCDNADTLGHCRDAAQAHVRGCWVVDRVLGKT